MAERRLLHRIFAATMILSSKIHISSALLNLPEWEGKTALLESNSTGLRRLLALGSEDQFMEWQASPETLRNLQLWLDQHKTWVFGVLGYPIRNAIHTRCETRYGRFSSFPAVSLFRPKVVLEITDDSCNILHNSSRIRDEELLCWFSPDNIPDSEAGIKVKLNPLISREEYLRDVESLLHHIHIGDIYEINYCQEFQAHCHVPDPYKLWLRLNNLTAAPMAGYFRFDHLHLLCASPERFLKKEGNTVRSQPIKGTIRRGATGEEDSLLRHTLFTSPKERSENVMIVDLVRNDLSRSALPGSVAVEELFGIHTFSTVHHMISTIRAQWPEDIPFTAGLSDLFPMGSMTGAPKIEAMKLIDRYEHSDRGWYSGTLGYIEPSGDFDFNVIIRSLLYNSQLSELSCSVGSAITAKSDPEKEYEECHLKLDAIRRALQ